MVKQYIRDLGVGVFFLAVSVLYLTGTFSISTFSPFGRRGLDSRSIPQLIGALGCLLSILQITVAAVKARGWRRSLSSESNDSEAAPLVCDASSSERETSGRRGTVLLLMSFFLLAAYIALFRQIGFVASTILYLSSSILLLTPDGRRLRSLPFVAIFSVGVSFLIYFIFTKYLSLVLPRGILW